MWLFEQLYMHLFCFLTYTGVINSLFDRVERYHGYKFVMHTLSYLTASKNGLSDMEIEDILSLDDEVKSTWSAQFSSGSCFYMFYTKHDNIDHFET